MKRKRRRVYYHPGQDPRPRKMELTPVKPASTDRPMSRQVRRAMERAQRKGQ